MAYNDTQIYLGFLFNIGEVEKNTNTAKSTKKSQKKGNYVVKIVDGVKYMVLK